MSMNKGGFRMSEKDIKSAAYKTDNDFYIKLTHTPTGISVGQETEGRSVESVKKSLFFRLKSKINEALKEAKRNDRPPRP